MDTHEDNVLKEATTILAEQAALLIEKTRFQKLLTGKNVFRAGAADALVSTRDAVVGTMTIGLQRKIVRALKRNLARPITSVVKSTAAYGTEPIAPAFVCGCHPDMEPVIREMSGFVPAEKYGSMPAWETELGKVEDVRYLTSTVVESWADAGGATGSMISTSGTSADVYPMFFLAKDAYGLVPLKGAGSITPMVVNPKPSDSDPLAQRGHVSWKAWSGSIILNESWMVRAECAAIN
jgi:N4-gp56 family major capsid protein